MDAEEGDEAASLGSGGESKKQEAKTRTADEEISVLTRYYCHPTVL